jgi:hypothetical protein
MSSRNNLLVELGLNLESGNGTMMKNYGAYGMGMGRQDVSNESGSWRSLDAPSSWAFVFGSRFTANFENAPTENGRTGDQKPFERGSSFESWCSPEELSKSMLPIRV